jgi:hypothetical protein
MPRSYRLWFGESTWIEGEHVAVRNSYCSRTRTRRRCKLERRRPSKTRRHRGPFHDLAFDCFWRPRHVVAARLVRDRGSRSLSPAELPSLRSHEALALASDQQSHDVGVRGDDIVDSSVASGNVPLLLRRSRVFPTRIVPSGVTERRRDWRSNPRHWARIGSRGQVLRCRCGAEF